MDQQPDHTPWYQPRTAEIIQRGGEGFASSIGQGIQNFAQGIATGLEKRKEEEKTRAREFKALSEYAVARGYASKDQSTTMDLESLRGLVRAKEAAVVAEEQKTRQDLALQQLAQLKRQTQQDQTFADTLQARTRSNFTMPPVGSDPTGMVAFAGLPSRTATSQRVPNRDDLLAAMAAAPMSGASKELMNYRLLQGDPAERNIEFQEDPVSGQRFATFGNMMQPSGTNPTRIAANSAPTVSPDGKFFHDGRKWVAIKQLGYPEGSTIVTENGQTVIKGPDGRLLTPPRSSSPFAALFGGAPAAEGGASVPASRAPAGPATVNSQEEYDALPKGAEYRDSQGNIRRKK